jgi:hypothetical protein
MTQVKDGFTDPDRVPDGLLEPVVLFADLHVVVLDPVQQLVRLRQRQFLSAGAGLVQPAHVDHAIQPVDVFLAVLHGSVRGSMLYPDPQKAALPWW